MNTPQNPDNKHDKKLPDLSAIESKWTDIFSGTLENYHANEPNPLRRHSIVLVTIAFFGIIFMSFIRVEAQFITAFLILIAFVLVLSHREHND